MREVKVAAVSALSFDGEEEYKNAERAKAYVDEAACQTLLALPVQSQGCTPHCVSKRRG